jgi:hypothetical protein
LASELGECTFEGELATRDLQALDEIAGAHEQYAPSALDEREPDGCRKMALASAGRAEQQEIGALFEPAIACGERHHLRLADHRHHLEVEAVEGFAHRQSCCGKVTLDAAATAIGDFVLGERGKEASCGPAFLVRLLGELDPHQFDGRQAQIGKEELDARGIDRIDRLHATSPSSARAVIGALTATSSS